ncbi:hypothetical protein FDW83_06530 [Pseudarthrobacter sp. NamE2]|uniref:hypothetical protein n=1 Tax=Pseudarthrobacter sp. NamE2 TaxID=2576838 RepID=UPI0010FDA4DC|nr:hypothetical protein [Pseudarthrobacter sp. NamE2]TLM84377.1 hypothetical protein FDW83_06530 [Pseudarthrobacter sp. NamE2]
MPSVRRHSAPPHPGTAPALHAQKRASAVVLGLVLAAGAATAGCEYTYDDGRGWSGTTEPGPTAAPAPVFTRDPLRRDPVPEDELDGWVSRTLSDTPQPVVHAGAGLLAAGEVRTEATPVLETGTYALALACRSQRRVTFVVRSDTLTLVDLGLRCGVNRENVIYLSAETALSVTVEARTGANFAYRLRRL